MTQGSLDGNLITCAWHNWKFRVDDGDVRGRRGGHHHPPGDRRRRRHVLVTLRRARCRGDRGRACSPACAAGSSATTSVRSAATWSGCCRPTPIPANWSGRRCNHGAPRADFGWGHSIASATDCLAMVDLYEGDQRALPIVQAIAGIAETERDRPVNPLPDPVRQLPADPLAAFREAVEARAVGRCPGAGARSDPRRQRRRRSAAVVHGRRQRPSAVVRSRCDLLPEGVRTARHDRLGSCRHRAAAPRADDRLRHPRGPAALHPPIHARARRRRPRRAGERCRSTTDWHDDGTLLTDVAGQRPQGDRAGRRRERCAAEPASTACSTSWSRPSANG